MSLKRMLLISVKGIDLFILGGEYPNGKVKMS